MEQALAQEQGLELVPDPFVERALENCLPLQEQVRAPDLNCPERQL